MRKRMGPAERALRDSRGNIMDLADGFQARAILMSAAAQHNMLIAYCRGNEVDADVFSYAIEAAEALGL